jgi:hypothetical protein
LLAGIWLFISPWVYGAYANPSAWNSWIVGALLFIFAASRLGNQRASQLSWFNVVLGAWTFVSPWVYGYTASGGRFVNSLCVGVIVFFAAIMSANATSHTPPPLPSGTART